MGRRPYLLEWFYAVLKGSIVREKAHLEFSIFLPTPYIKLKRLKKTKFKSIREEEIFLEYSRRFSKILFRYYLFLRFINREYSLISLISLSILSSYSFLILSDRGFSISNRYSNFSISLFLSLASWYTLFPISLYIFELVICSSISRSFLSHLPLKRH